ncbi:MAG TPA: DUF1653 domain-containing protein [Candidatus Saccharibacteria bacterium]|nr:DUF1653 domain-containing protein [Candidatus Saccharibacteria bacterium]
MTHKGKETLLAELEKAKTLVTVGGYYTHYKSPDKQYKVTQIAILEATDELCVIYQAQYGEKLSFVRPLTSWLETVRWQNNLVPRFNKL